MNTSPVYHTVLDFNCPFCGQPVAILEPPAIMHNQPICDTFRDTEVIEFIRLCRLSEMLRGGQPGLN